MPLFEELSNELISRSVSSFYTTAIELALPTAEPEENKIDYFMRYSKWLEERDFKQEHFVRIGDEMGSYYDRSEERFDKYRAFLSWTSSTFPKLTPSMEMAENIRKTMGVKATDYPQLMFDGANEQALMQLWSEFMVRSKEFGIFTFKEMKERMKTLEETLVSEGKLSAQQVTTISSGYWKRLEDPSNEEKALKVTKHTVRHNWRHVAELGGHSTSRWHPRNWFKPFRLRRRRELPLYFDQ